MNSGGSKPLVSVLELGVLGSIRPGRRLNADPWPMAVLARGCCAGGLWSAPWLAGAHEKFSHRTGNEARSEIALNPATFRGRTDREIASTLLHEMVHLWQYYFGKPPRKGYHNREWGDKMESLGLMPSEDGQPGGKRTGQRVTHYIIEGGPFACEWAKLEAA